MSDDIDFDSLSPKDCASYLCVSKMELATEYIEAGCPGPFSEFQLLGDEDLSTLAINADKGR